MKPFTKEELDELREKVRPLVEGRDCVILMFSKGAEEIIGSHIYQTKSAADAILYESAVGLHSEKAIKGLMLRDGSGE